MGNRNAYCREYEQAISEILKERNVFTNSMLKRLVVKSDFKFGTVKRIIKTNSCVAWILKSENRLLPKSNRGDTLKDALNIYSEKGIILIDSRRKVIK